MKWKSEDPRVIYKMFDYNKINILIENEDDCEITRSNAMNICDEHMFSPSSGNKVTSVYYIRGIKKKADYENILIASIEAIEQLPEELFEIIHCLKFWNQEGPECYTWHKEDQETYQHFILNCIAADCRAFVEPCKDKFITGKDGDHVWVANKINNHRILMIHF